MGWWNTTRFRAVGHCVRWTWPIFPWFALGAVGRAVSSPGWADLRTELQGHYERLGAVSASGIVELGETVETDPGVLAFRAQYEEGAIVEWRQEGSSGYKREFDPTGELVREALFRDGRTIDYDHEEKHGTKSTGYTGHGRMSPSVYFLQVRPRSFLELLSSARIEEVTGEERALGATGALVLLDAESSPRLQLRVAVDGERPRVLRVELSYEAEDGSLRSVERCTFDDWTLHGREPFPLRIIREALGPGGSVTDVQLLELSEPGSEEVPLDLHVPQGSTYYEEGSGEGSWLIGRLPGEELAEALRRLGEWCASHPPARLFTGVDVDLPAATGRLAAWRPAGEEVPLQTSRADYDCGPIALGLAMSLALGEGAPLPAIDVLLQAGARGVSLAQLADTARRLGIRAEPRRAAMSELLEAELPAILPVRLEVGDPLPSHLLLLAGRVGAQPLLMNPPAESFHPDPGWLESHWTGDALLIGGREAPTSPRSRRLGLGFGALALVLLAADRWIRGGRRWKPGNRSG